MHLMSAIGQALDYIFKAVKAYAETPEGAKEFQDVINALEGTDSVVETETVSRSYRK